MRLVGPLRGLGTYGSMCRGRKEAMEDHVLCTRQRLLGMNFSLKDQRDLGLLPHFVRDALEIWLPAFFR